MPIQKDNERFSVYLHPVSICGSLLPLEKGGFFYLTAEYPLNGFYSIIMAPSIWSGNFLRNDRHYFRLGSGVGIRRFFNGKSDGFYLQLMPSAYYTRQEGYWSNTLNALYRDYPIDRQYHDKTISGSIIDILGYVGYSMKFSHIRLFFDVGMGYAWNSLYPDPEDDLPFFLQVGYNKNYATTYSGAVSIDFNLGIGFAF
ncbi:MAG: hypothetical protein FWC26_10490 [Fibromonadales bacterium]|nr:hypothetical protein [Fibromonadales bacterium]